MGTGREVKRQLELNIFPLELLSLFSLPGPGVNFGACGHRSCENNLKGGITAFWNCSTILWEFALYSYVFHSFFTFLSCVPALFM
uniref:Uncharacterized protein n=1 Tax=Rhizophora mucronata TaxID=61149 RepID=A0A2P2MSU5_RHIMU